MDGTAACPAGEITLTIRAWNSDIAITEEEDESKVPF